MEGLLIAVIVLAIVTAICWVSATLWYRPLVRKLDKYHRKTNSLGGEDDSG